MPVKSFCGNFARIKKGCFLEGIDFEKSQKQRTVNLNSAFTALFSSLSEFLDKCSLKNNRYYDT